jgi:hypothetical protein
MCSTFRFASGKLHQSRPTRYFSSATRLYRAGDKVYFQQASSNHQVPPIQSQVAPARKNLAGLLWANLILCTAAIYYYTTSTPAERSASSTTCDATTVGTDYLSVQTALHNSIASNVTRLLFKYRAAVMQGGPGENYDPIRDVSVWKKHPLKLADGTKVDESNAIFIKVYDIFGIYHSAILLVDTYERPRAGGIGTLLGRPSVLSKRTQWVDNSTPIQKWLINIAIEEREKGISTGDLGAGGMTLIYVTRDTCGVGAYGSLDGSRKSDVIDSAKPEEAMMHCVPIMEERFQNIFSLFKIMKTQRRGPASQPTGPGPQSVWMVPQPDGSKILRLPQPDGSYKEVTNIRGEVSSHPKIENAFYLKDMDDDSKPEDADPRKLVIVLEEDRAGVKTLSAKLPNGQEAMISQLKGNVQLQMDIKSEFHLVETLPNGRKRELGMVMQSTKATSSTGREAMNN